MISTVTVPFVPVLVGAIGLSILQLLLFFVSLWMIFLILIQRGKGGGLTAAFGGGGGDSAFGAKAGDAFTKITIVTALVWITLCMVTIAAYNPPDSPENPFAQNEQEADDNDSGPSMGSGLSSEGEAESGSEAESESEAAGTESENGESETESSSADPATDDADAGDTEAESSEP